VTGRHAACLTCGSRILVARFSGSDLTTCSNDRCATHLVVDMEDTAAIRTELTRRIQDGEDYPR
jgi:hypothetical protein